MGTKSGKDIDKIKEMGLTTVFNDNTPYFNEAKSVMLLKKLYAQEMNTESFFDKSCDEKWYAQKDYHTMYVCEITKVLVAE